MHRGVPTSLKTGKNRYVMLCSTQGLPSARPPGVSTSLADAREKLQVRAERILYLWFNGAVKPAERRPTERALGRIAGSAGPGAASSAEVDLAVEDVDRIAGEASATSLWHVRRWQIDGPSPSRRRQHSGVPLAV